jgi:hypothetical protein
MEPLVEQRSRQRSRQRSQLRSKSASAPTKKQPTKKQPTKKKQTKKRRQKLSMSQIEALLVLDQLDIENEPNLNFLGVDLQSLPKTPVSDGRLWELEPIESVVTMVEDGASKDAAETADRAIRLEKIVANHDSCTELLMLGAVNGLF